MARKSYAQFGEDLRLHALFGDDQGVCVEVGGHDGVSGSMSLYFEEMGWTCLVVEPIPELAAAIRARRRCLVAEAAADEAEGEATLLVPEGSETFATLDNDNTRRSRIGELQGEMRKVRVRTRRLDDLMADAGVSRVDFISIDVEGNELNVLKGLSLDRWNPRFLILEDNSFCRDRSIPDHLRLQGYRLMRIWGVNHWYCRADDPAFTMFARLQCACMAGVVRLYGAVTGRGRQAG
jgi:FkbM family methyltransferase